MLSAYGPFQNGGGLGLEVRAGPVCLECGQDDPAEGVLQALPRRIGRGHPPVRPHSSEVVVRVSGDGFHSGLMQVVGHWSMRPLRRVLLASQQFHFQRRARGSGPTGCRLATGGRGY